jgi:hypothetical protein
MTTSSYSAPAPDAPYRTGITTRTIGDQLWKKVLLEAGSLEIRDSCEEQLHEIIEQGAERMTVENRVGPADIFTAEQNLGRFVGLMKHNAQLLGHPDWLGEDTLRAADEALIVLAFRPWPFKWGKPYEHLG